MKLKLASCSALFVGKGPFGRQSDLIVMGVQRSQDYKLAELGINRRDTS